MNRSRYFSIPLLAAFSLALSLALLPLNSGAVSASDIHADQPASVATPGPA